MSGIADARREARGVRVTVAVLLLVVATVLTVAALASRRPPLVTAAVLLTLVLAWVALRLAWNALVLARYQHAVERTELARTYRGLFAQRAVEHAAYASSMGARLAWSRQRADDLRETLSKVEIRAVEAESTAREAQARINRYDDQIAAMSRLLEGGDRRTATGDPSDPVTDPVTDFATFKPDSIASLMAWEEHASRVRAAHAGPASGFASGLTGRHSVG